jgi:hypothetical protein
MTRELWEVWRCTNAVHDAVFIDKADADSIEVITGMPATVTRLPLLTPEDAAVLEAAEAWEKGGPISVYNALLSAVRARRAARGEG